MRIDDAIVESIKLLQDSAGRTIERIEHDAEDMDPDEIFNALVSIAEAKAQLRDFEGKLNQLMVQYMRFNGEKVREYGAMFAERKIVSVRKNWQHQTLIESVVNKALTEDLSSVVDPSTGEIVDLSTVAKPLIDAVVKNLYDAAAIREWRVKALRAMIPGLNPDDFCEVEKAERVAIRRK